MAHVAKAFDLVIFRLNVLLLVASRIQKNYLALAGKNFVIKTVFKQRIYNRKYIPEAGDKNWKHDNSILIMHGKN